MPELEIMFDRGKSIIVLISDDDNIKKTIVSLAEQLNFKKPKFLVLYDENQNYYGIVNKHNVIGVRIK